MESLTPAQRRIYQAALRLLAVQKAANQINISDLAQETGMSRSTVYSHLDSIDDLFHRVASHLAEDMFQRVVKSFGDLRDPAERLANGIRYFTRHAHEEKHWGPFLTRYALSEALIQDIWFGAPTADVAEGIRSGRYTLPAEQLPSIMSMIAGSVLGAIYMVIEGHRTWRDAGSETAEMVLRALGVDAQEAHQLAMKELPPLAHLD